MSPDHPLLACIASAHDSRMAVFVAPEGVTATLDGEPYPAPYLHNLPGGFYIVRPQVGVGIGNLVELPFHDAIAALLRARLIEPKTTH